MSTLEHAPARPLTLRRRLAYAGILAVLVLVVLLGGLEGGLRLSGYGDSPRFARRAQAPDGSEVWRENRDCTAPFFSRELVRRPQPMRLPIPKGGRTCRIFVLGSSAAMGDPEASFSVARMLEAMLGAMYPEVRFEVVNAGITAINSHVVRGIATDCAALSSDLFIVYEGNNEVIGPFGPAGVLAPHLRSERAVRAAVALKSTRTGQLVAAAARSLAGGRGAPVEWGGMEMFLGQRIAADDPRLETVRAHFRANLRAIAGAARRSGADTLLCTVGVNQRTFAPFASLHRQDLSAEDRSRWEQACAAGENAMRAGDIAAALAAYRTAFGIDDRHAGTCFLLGRLALQAGREEEARELLQRAVDLDALRFRTDASLNAVIREFHAAPGVRVIDAAAALAAASPSGICGDEFFYEHVHLTWRGAHELARALLPAIHGSLVARGLANGAAPAEPSLEFLRQRLAFTAYEQGMIAAEMLARVQRAPFTAQSDHAIRLEAWRRRAAAAAAVLERDDATTGLRAVYDAALELAPDDWILARNAGMMLVARGAAAEGVPYLEQARAWIDDDVDTLAALVTAWRATGRADDADAALARLRSLEPRHPAAR